MLIGADETAAYSTFQPWFVGTVKQMVPSDQGFTFRFRDTLAFVTDQPLGSAKYPGGDAALTTVDGQDDLKDRWRPVLYGKGENLPAILCNTGKLVYQVADKPAIVTAAYTAGCR